ncbi:MAG: carboxypeptidase-like regulatory domain-containing protein [Bifidobacteriaceae bacterium]|jgi:hypothetical protein|nr:carboxypeptidase-like regulatory domain-containing protein [Bifidobacteriaceae bacterium]
MKRVPPRVAVAALATLSLGLISSAIPMSGAIGTAGLPDTVGTVAGQPLEYCGANALPLGDDVWSPEINLGFTGTYYSDNYDNPVTFDKVFISENGALLFSPYVGFDPTTYDFDVLYSSAFLRNSDWQAGATPTATVSPNAGAVTPMAVPFLADATNAAPGSSVTWGQSEDGKTLCVVWAGIASADYPSAAANTFQLLLTSRTGTSGRADGDFDIVFNYDSIEWDKSVVYSRDPTGGPAGDKEVGPGAFHSNGSSEPGTDFTIDGTGEVGALVNGGPKGLISQASGSVHPGRFVFEVRNADHAVTFGSLGGQVTDSVTGDPVANLTVRATSGARTYWGSTNADGDFLLPIVRAGEYELEISGGDYYPGYTTQTVATATLTTADVALRRPPALPTSGDVTVISPWGSIDTGIPTVHYMEPFEIIVTNQCVRATAEWTLTVGSFTATGPLKEGPAGTYSATVDELYPQHGTGLISYVIVCPGGAPTNAGEFAIYIDPSGVVVDQFGTPVQGATVTLLREDEVLGVFEEVPAGSAVMDLSNRVNPWVTTSNGRFNWNVIDGTYKIRVEKPGSATVETQAMDVPPERTDLVISIGVPGAKPPAPVTLPTVSPAAIVAGTTVSVNTGAWPEAVRVDTVTWKLDGTSIGTGAAVRLPDSAAEQRLSIILGAHREVLGLPQGIRSAPEAPLTAFEYHFDYTLDIGPVAAPSEPITKPDTEASPPPLGVPGPAEVQPEQPGIPALLGVARVGETLTASGTPWPTGTTLTYQWLADGQPIAGAQSQSLALTATLKGKTIQVQVTGVKGTSTWQQISPIGAKVAAGQLAKKPVPKISGKAKSGAKLRAKAGTWDKGVDVSYRWYVSGKAIKGATTSVLKVRSAWVGKTIRVKVTAKKAGYTTVVKTSKRTAKIK